MRSKPRRRSSHHRRRITRLTDVPSLLRIPPVLQRLRSHRSELVRERRSRPGENLNCFASARWLDDEVTLVRPASLFFRSRASRHFPKGNTCLFLKRIKLK